jgi:hypothetical protein
LHISTLLALLTILVSISYFCVHCFSVTDTLKVVRSSSCKFLPTLQCFPKNIAKHQISSILKTGRDMPKKFTYASVAEHSKRGDLYLIYRDQVLDATKFMNDHPYVNRSFKLHSSLSSSINLTDSDLNQRWGRSSFGRCRNRCD